MNAITANGEFSNEGRIKRKPSMFYISVVSSISTVKESMAAHTYLKHMLILCLSATWAQGEFSHSTHAELEQERKCPVGFEVFSCPCWRCKWLCHPCPSPPTLIALTHAGFLSIPPLREHSGANCLGWSEMGTDVTTCCKSLSSHELLKRHFIF